MAIKHSFVSLKAAGADTTLVRPPDWNADHTIDDATISYAKIQNVSATNRLLGRSSSGAGVIEEISCTAAGRALLDDATAADQRTTLGLGTASTENTTAFEAAGSIATHAAVTSSVHGISSFGATLVDDTTAAAARTTLGLAAVAASGSASDLGTGTLPAGRMPALTGDVTSSSGTAATTIANSAVTLAKMADLATQRVIGRDTAGTGVPEAITASQLFDWVSNTNGVLLTRTSGSWAALANVGTHGGDLVFTSGTPTTPSSGAVKASGYALAGRQMLATTTPDAIVAPVQACLGAKKVVWWQPQPNSNTTTIMGMAAFAYSGSATARAPAATGVVAGSRRLGVVSANPAGSIAGARHGVLTWWRGDAAGRGGFHMVWRWNISDAVLVTDARMFVGIIGTASAPSDVEPSTLTNLIGVGCNGGDTTMQLYAADGSARSRTDLGANFPVNTTNTDIYELHLYCPPNASGVGYTLIRIGTPYSTSSTITGATNLPSSTTLLTGQAWRTNNTTAAACAIDLHDFYVETET